MARTSYLIQPGTTAEQLAEQREYAQALLANAASTSPKGHWAHIPAQMLQGALGGYEHYEIGQERRRADDEAAGLFSEAFSALGGAPSSGATPGAAAAAGAPSPSPARAAAAAAGRAGAMDNATDDLLGMVRKEEGFAPVAKWDVRQHSGGYGSKSAPGETFTREKAEQYLARDGAPVIQWVNANAPNASPTQKQALVSFGYNLGVDDLEKLKPDIQAGDWNRVGQRMLSFNNAATGPGGQLQPMGGLTQRRQREAGMIRGGFPSTPPAEASAAGGGQDLVTKLYRNEKTRPIAVAILQARIAGDKKRHVVAPGATLVDDAGNRLFTGPAEDATAKARQQAIGKGQGEAQLALPAAVSRAGETVGILNKIRAHPGLDAATGATGLVQTRIPGTDAYDFEQLRSQAQGTAFLTAIGEMRGTGAISNIEGEAATQAVGRMRGAQSKGAFLDALNDYERVVMKGVANTYRQAGLEVPPELLGATGATPRGAGAPAGGEALGATPAPAEASAAPGAPEGLSEGAIFRSKSGKTLTVRDGRLVPMDSAPSPAPASPAGPASGAMGSAGASSMGEAPRFEGNVPGKGSFFAFRDDKAKLLESPSAAAIAAFNELWGPGAGESVIRRAAGDGRAQRPMGKGTYQLTR